MKNHYSNFYKKLHLSYLLLILTLLFMTSCETDDQKTENLSAQNYDSKVVTDWYSLIKTLTTETVGYTPPVAARAFGYTSIALYEAVEKGIPNKSTLSGKLNGLNISINYDENQKHHWPTVANAVLSEMTKYFYNTTAKEKYTAILELEKKYNYSFSSTNPKDIIDRSILLGKETAGKIIEWSKSDGGLDALNHNFPTNYSPPIGDKYWKPTSPEYMPALQPYWGQNRPFLPINIENTTPPNPPPFSKDINSLCYKRATEVYNVVLKATPEQIKIAEFWSDDPVTTATPPGHSISILNQLLIKNKSNLAISAEAYAKLGIAISDAFISCWKTKYETNYIRPITYINNYIDPDWNPILITPPFPEYPSGHSVQSGALAEIMTAFFGDNHEFIDRTHENRKDIDGSPRSFSSFYKMAEEAAISRLYGGIHYHEAIYLGLEQGYQIGRNVNKLNLNQ